MFLLSRSRNVYFRELVGRFQLLYNMNKILFEHKSHIHLFRGFTLNNKITAASQFYKHLIKRKDKGALIFNVNLR